VVFIGPQSVVMRGFSRTFLSILIVRRRRVFICKFRHRRLPIREG